jgi:hypothetical protein
LSFQIRIFSPFPTLQTNPSPSKSQELKILLQAKDGLDPNFASKIELPGKYFALIILATKLSGWDHNLQACFANKALLKLRKSQKPIPPAAFDNPIRPQLI